MSLKLLQQYRRDLHQIPEIGLVLPKTKDYLVNVLSQYDCQLYFPTDYSVLAFFDNHKQDTIAFRSDMDALPVLEQTHHHFGSQHEGQMHACGHDGHMALLLTFASRVNEFYQSLDHNILLVFQPGEELWGGAKQIVQSGIFETLRVTHIFGSHLWPSLPEGVIQTKPGDLMARCAELDIHVTGKSSHIARSHEGIDALAMASELVVKTLAYEKTIEDLHVLRFGSINAGIACNVVAEKCHLKGSIRSFNDALFTQMQTFLDKTAKEIEQAYGGQIHIDYLNPSPAVRNDAELTKKVMETLHIDAYPHPEMISEDFADYQQVMPGTFFFIGTASEYPLHHGQFDFNEEVLLPALDLYEKLAKL